MNEDQYLDSYWEDQTEMQAPDPDDFEQYNRNEADDYEDEGGESEGCAEHDPDHEDSYIEF